MKVFAVLILCVSLCHAQDLNDDAESVKVPQWYLVPLHRNRRQTNWSLSGPKLTGSVSHQGTIFNSPNHRLDGSAYASKNFAQSRGLQPDMMGGRLDYSHKPTGSGVSVGADHMRGGGTDLSATGRYNIYNTKNWNVGVSGEYSRHFGGPGGTGRPNYGAFLSATGRF
ncbi:uncharacterized protein LOC132705412 [Cylas formicarius]|uniref:uncharacterized protein LOC132705412 n=1 Tax=Cylas formicarius TaxID=197179 RepID=UPI002958720E|nr:uncharacterized protein LOC132705412 [Cylas formicarius]